MMAVPCPTTISEVIWYALLGVAILAFGELRWTIHRFINRVEEMPEKYVTQKSMDEWKEGRDPIWKAFNKHSHKGIEGEGEVIRK